MNLNQLRIFYHTAKNLSFTQAASELFITQPAVTAQIKGLEGFCSLKLFKKKGKRIHLTDEGSVLLEYAKAIFEHEKEIESAIEEMKELKRGTLRLGTTKTYARYFMPTMVSAFRERYPSIKIQLHEGSSSEMTQALVHFTIEVAVIAIAEDHPDVCFIPFSKEDLVVIAAPHHPLTMKRVASVQELSREPIIMKETGSGTRKVVNALFAREKCSPNILMETSSTEFIKQLVQRGEGISFLVRAAVARDLEEGRVAPIHLKDKELVLDVSIAYLISQHLSPPARGFLDILKDLSKADSPPQDIEGLMARIMDHTNKPHAIPCPSEDPEQQGLSFHTEVSK